MAVQHAREFHKHVTVIFNEIPKELNQTSEYMGERSPTLVYFATNLIFSAELFLKSIYAIQRKPAPITHNIWNLYKGLPKADQDNIERLYKDEIQKYDNPNSLHLLITRTRGISDEDVRAKLFPNEKATDDEDTYGLTGLAPVSPDTQAVAV